MRWAPLVGILLAFSLLGGCFSKPPAAKGEEVPTVDGRGDAVVVAVIDSGFNPYHFDFLAEFMPQATNDDPSDDLPLDEDPATWLPGFPGPGAFASYDRLDLGLSPDDSDSASDRHAKDKAEWNKVKRSTSSAAHLRWIPGTKVIGAVTFAATGDGFASGSHGVGTSSVSVGNFHGACPECLLVFVDGPSEEANRWVESQPWIDLQTNSWGFSASGVARDRVYAGSDTEAQRAAVDRGQSIFFSAGNGVENGFLVTNPTLFSSQEGPDWITTVGAVLSDGSITGAGKPADISAPGAGYPSAYGSAKLNDTKSFGGTSNATPVTAGLYAEALYQLRRQLTGASRVQTGGTIASGPAGCGPANAACALSDGNLTVHELREALFRSANYTGSGYKLPVGPVPPIPSSEDQKELLFAGAGHGTFWGRLHDDTERAAEARRIAGYASGVWTSEQDPDQRAWFVADSICRQSGWGAWSHGYAGLQPEPQASPQWPIRTWFVQVCPKALPVAVTVERLVPRPADLLP